METSDLTDDRQAAPYGEKLINYQFNGQDIFVISDLHMAAGVNSTGNYEGTENFFADQSFGRFVDHLLNKVAGTALLVINGDLVDFLRITNIPETEDDFIGWSLALSKIGINRSVDGLKDSIVKKERTYGLKTDDYKSVWKLQVCAAGHKQVFDGLAKWLASGHKLIIVKGNHDLEWYWKPVRDYMSVTLSERISGMKNSTTSFALNEFVIPNLTFADDSLIINGDIYVEHGHCYENFTKVYGPAVLKGESELNLPFGSFFNRYLINRIELAYPYIDDVRPRENILPVLIQERFPLAIKLLFSYIPLAFLVIPKRQYKYALKYLFQFLLIVVLPLAAAVFVFLNFVKISTDTSTLPSIIQLLISSAKSLVLLILSYFLTKLFAMLKLSPPNGLFKNAQAIFNRYPYVKVVTFGHTHDPEQKANVHRSKRYYNTGTWIPVFETDAADVRLDRTFTLLHLVKDNTNTIAQTCLMRWNDDALRIDEIILIEKK